MKKYLLGLMIVILLLSIGAGCAPGEVAPVAVTSPNVVVTPSVVPLSSKATVVIMGSGYHSGQELRILIADKFVGGLTRLDTLWKPPVVANERGSWVAVWTLGEDVPVLDKGMFAILVADVNLNILASAPVGFVDPKVPKEQWPEWARLAAK